MRTPAGRRCTEKASSISVVPMSSRLNAVRGADVVQAERRYRSLRKVARQRRQLMRRERRAAGEELVEKALQVVGVAVRQPPASLEELRRGQAGPCAGLLQRLGFGLVPVRGVEKLVLQVGDWGWALASP
jgi:hypothetical protein